MNKQLKINWNYQLTIIQRKPPNIFHYSRPFFFSFIQVTGPVIHRWRNTTEKLFRENMASFPTVLCLCSDMTKAKISSMIVQFLIQQVWNLSLKKKTLWSCVKARCSFQTLNSLLFWPHLAIDHDWLIKVTMKQRKHALKHSDIYLV